MVKLEEIARLANVSVATASLALNNKPGVSQKTKQKVLQIATEQNYDPLRKHQKKYDKTIRLVIAVDSPEMDQQYRDYPFIANLIACLERELLMINYRLIINSIHPDKLITTIDQLEELLPTNNILLMATGLTAEDTKVISNYYHDIVFIDINFSKQPIRSISTNNYLGGYMAAKYLLQNNHRNISYVSGSVMIHNFKQRLEGFEFGLYEANQQVVNSYFKLSAEIMTIDESVTGFKLTNVKDMPTAFFCENDIIALTAINYFRSIGLRVPEDVSVIGFDGLSKLDGFEPNITSVSFNTDDIIGAILGTCVHNTGKFQLVINPTILERGTVKHR